MGALDVVRRYDAGMKKVVVVLLALIASASAVQLANSESRTAVDLNGEWKITVDPYDVGLTDYRGKIRPDGYFRNAKPRDGYDLVEYDFDKSESLRVPGDWNSQRDKFFFYEGSIWSVKWVEKKAQASAAKAAGSATPNANPAE